MVMNPLGQLSYIEFFDTSFFYSEGRKLKLHLVYVRVSVRVRIRVRVRYDYQINYDGATCF